MQHKVLDHGFVTLVDNMGSDLTVVNAARVSFGKRKEELDEADNKLIRYLAQHQHYSPFRHVQLQFHCKVPEFVARQWYKHVVGISYTEQATVDHAWNEISMRYVDASEFDFYIPTEYRKQSKKNKQGSVDDTVYTFQPHVRASTITYNTVELQYYATPINEKVGSISKAAVELYNKMLKAGVAKEQARMVLPLNVYTEFYWTVSLQALVNFIKLRKHKGAQWEIREYANAIESIAQRVCPLSLQALTG